MARDFNSYVWNLDRGQADDVCDWADRNVKGVDMNTKRITAVERRRVDD